MSGPGPGLLDNKLAVFNGVPVLMTQEDFEERCCKDNCATSISTCAVCIGNCDCCSFNEYVCCVTSCSEHPELVSCSKGWPLSKISDCVYEYNGPGSVTDSTIKITLEFTSFECPSYGQAFATLTVYVNGELVGSDDSIASGGYSSTWGTATYKCSHSFSIDGCSYKTRPSQRRIRHASVTFSGVDLDSENFYVCDGWGTWCGTFGVTIGGVGGLLSGTYVLGDEDQVSCFMEKSYPITISACNSFENEENCSGACSFQANNATLYVRLYHQNDGDVIVKAFITASLRIGKNILGWECRRTCSSMHISIHLFSGTTSGVTCEESYETTVDNDYTAYTTCCSSSGDTCRRGKNGSASVSVWHTYEEVA